MTSSSKSNEVFEIRGTFNCNSKNVVYLLECQICKIQYIGETKLEFRQRYSGHKSDYNSDINARSNNALTKGHPIAKHFLETGHSLQNFRATILKGHFKDDLDRKCFESKLIHEFNSHKAGLNQNSGLFTIF